MAFEHEGAQQGDDVGYLVGLVADCLLAEREPEAMAERREQMDVESALVLAAAQSLAVQGDRLVFGRAWRQSSQDALGPGTELGLELRQVQLSEDCRQGSRTRRRRVGQAERDDQLSGVDPRPLGDGAVAAIAAEDGNADQGKDGRQGMAFAASVSAVGYLGQHVDQHVDQRATLRYRLRYH